MNLLVDVGNSNICFGLIDKDKIVKTYRLKSFTDKTSDEFYLLFNNLIKESFDNVVISSVVPIITSALKKMFKSFYSIDAVILGPGVKTGIMLKADDPRSVGADLICDCAGAMKYTNECIIVDLGTATKYIYVKNNTFMGVSIAPGISISLKSLVSNTALLPQIELQTPKKIICNNTIACMQSGIIYGAAAQVDGMLDRIKAEIGNESCSVIATGGLSGLIIPLCKNHIDLNPNLLLEGLNEIYLKNI